MGYNERGCWDCMVRWAASTMDQLTSYHRSDDANYWWKVDDAAGS
jgi:hypothetical protein